MEILAYRRRMMKAVVPGMVGVLLSMVLGGYAQRTYMRTCDCEYVVDGKCAYTLFLPLNPNTLPPNGGSCPSSSGSSRLPSDELQYLQDNVTQIQKYSLEQSYTLTQLQSTLLAMQQEVISMALIQANDSKGVMELQSKVVTLQNQLKTLENSQQPHIIDSLKTANATLSRRTKELEDALDVSTKKVEILERTVSTLEDSLTTVFANNDLCRQRGLLVSDTNGTYMEKVEVTVSSQFNLDHGPNKVSVYTTIIPQAWCPRELIPLSTYLSYYCHIGLYMHMCVYVGLLIHISYFLMHVSETYNKQVHKQGS